MSRIRKVTYKQQIKLIDYISRMIWRPREKEVLRYIKTTIVAVEMLGESRIRNLEELIKAAKAVRDIGDSEAYSTLAKVLKNF